MTSPRQVEQPLTPNQLSDPCLLTQHLYRPGNTCVQRAFVTPRTTGAGNNTPILHAPRNVNVHKLKHFRQKFQL
jgi:hypothetical protein